MKIYLIIPIFSIVLFSCAEFVDYPLENKTVELIGPVDQLITKDSTLNFLWEPHEDATSYRVQIAKPNFDSIQLIPIDSITSRDHITLNLKPGKYQWRVRPENNGSVGKYSFRNLTILQK